MSSGFFQQDDIHQHTISIGNDLSQSQHLNSDYQTTPTHVTASTQSGHNHVPSQLHRVSHHRNQSQQEPISSGSFAGTLVSRPPWLPDTFSSRCMICTSSFGFLNRKHHCRACGKLVCADCSPHYVFLPIYGYTTEPVRICSLCHAVQRRSGHSQRPSSSRHSQQQLTPEIQQTSASTSHNPSNPQYHQLSTQNQSTAHTTVSESMFPSHTQYTSHHYSSTQPPIQDNDSHAQLFQQLPDMTNSTATPQPTSQLGQIAPPLSFSASFHDQSQPQPQNTMPPAPVPIATVPTTIGGGGNGDMQTNRLAQNGKTAPQSTTLHHAASYDSTSPPIVFDESFFPQPSPSEIQASRPRSTQFDDDDDDKNTTLETSPSNLQIQKLAGTHILTGFRLSDLFPRPKSINVFIDYYGFHSPLPQYLKVCINNSLQEQYKLILKNIIQLREQNQLVVDDIPSFQRQLYEHHTLATAFAQKRAQRIENVFFTQMLQRWSRLVQQSEQKKAAAASTTSPFESMPLSRNTNARAVRSPTSSTTTMKMPTQQKQSQQSNANLARPSSPTQTTFIIDRSNPVVIEAMWYGVPPSLRDKVWRSFLQFNQLKSHYDSLARQQFEAISSLYDNETTRPQVLAESLNKNTENAMPYSIFQGTSVDKLNDFMSSQQFTNTYDQHHHLKQTLLSPNGTSISPFAPTLPTITDRCQSAASSDDLSICSDNSFDYSQQQSIYGDHVSTAAQQRLQLRTNGSNRDSDGSDADVIRAAQNLIGKTPISASPLLGHTTPQAFIYYSRMKAAAAAAATAAAETIETTPAAESTSPELTTSTTVADVESNVVNKQHQQQPNPNQSEYSTTPRGGLGGLLSQHLLTSQPESHSQPISQPQKSVSFSATTLAPNTINVLQVATLPSFPDDQHALYESTSDSIISTTGPDNTITSNNVISPSDVGDNTELSSLSQLYDVPHQTHLHTSPSIGSIASIPSIVTSSSAITTPTLLSPDQQQEQLPQPQQLPTISSPRPSTAAPTTSNRPDSSTHSSSTFTTTLNPTPSNPPPGLLRKQARNANQHFAWAESAAKEAQRNPTTHYMLLLANLTSSCQWLRDIEKDVHRTLPNNKSFDRMAMRRILAAYSLHNAAVGYCQSMNSLAAAMLLVLRNEEDAFWALTYMVESILHMKLDNSLAVAHGLCDKSHTVTHILYHQDDLLGARIDTQVLSILIQERFPVVCAHLKTFEMEPHELTTSWLLSLFHDLVPLPLGFTIYDWLILEGPAVLFKFALFFIAHHEQSILQTVHHADAIQAMSRPLETLQELLSSFHELGRTIQIDPTLIQKLRQHAYNTIIMEEVALKERRAQFQNKTSAKQYQQTRNITVDVDHTSE